jgi:hypothetical protein
MISFKLRSLPSAVHILSLSNSKSFDYWALITSQALPPIHTPNAHNVVLYHALKTRLPLKNDVKYL